MTSRLSVRQIYRSVFFLALATTQAVAQQPIVERNGVPSALQKRRISAEPLAEDVAWWLRNFGGPGGRTLSVLTQTRIRQDKARLDEIADTLTTFAIGSPNDDLRAMRTRSVALTTLHLAGMGVGGSEGSLDPVPYAGASERLRKVALLSLDVGIRSAALTSLTELPDKSALLPFLRRVAMSRDAVAFRAIILLNGSTGVEGREIARLLYVSRAATEESARETLDRLAKANGWR